MVPRFARWKRRYRFLLICSLSTLFLLFLLRYPLACHYEARSAVRIAHSIYGSEKIPSHVLPILMPVCDRKDYLEEVLSHLKKVRLIQDTLLIISQDCGRQDVRDLIQRTQLPLPVLHMEHVRPFYGVPSVLNNEYATAANILFLLDVAFSYLHAEGAIVLESDLVPSIDFYEYHRWAFQWFLNRTNNLKATVSFKRGKSAHQLYDQTLTVSSFNMQSRPESPPLQIEPGRFMVWAWSTSRTNFIKYIRPAWTWFGNWDHVVQHSVREPNMLVSAQPARSRVRNIGRQGINFKETDDVRWNRSFGAVFIQENGSGPDYSRPPELSHWNREGFCELANICK